MKQSVSGWQVGGFIFTCILGTFLHFLYDLTGGSVAAALFSAVNESIWEHMKLLFYPMGVFALVEYVFWGNEYRSFWCVKLLGILAGLILIPVVYYTYTGILGASADWFNIAIFFLAAAVSFWLEIRFFQKELTCQLPAVSVIGMLIVIACAFVILTFAPPKIPLFQDPISGTYGYWR